MEEKARLDAIKLNEKKIIACEAKGGKHRPFEMDQLALKDAVLYKDAYKDRKKSTIEKIMGKKREVSCGNCNNKFIYRICKWEFSEIPYHPGLMPGCTFVFEQSVPIGDLADHLEKKPEHKRGKKGAKATNGWQKRRIQKFLLAKSMGKSKKNEKKVVDEEVKKKVGEILKKQEKKRVNLGLDLNMEDDTHGTALHDGGQTQMNHEKLTGDNTIRSPTPFIDVENVIPSNDDQNLRGPLKESAMTNSTAGAITGVNGSVAAFAKKSKGNVVKKVLLPMPEGETELPEEFMDPALWLKLKVNEKLRAGLKRNLVKAIQESLEIEGLMCLKPQGWVIDNTFNCYLNMLCEKTKDRAKYIPTHTIQYFNKHGTIAQPWYWSTENVQLVLAAANLYGNHWALIIANLEKKEINIMDSMNGRKKTAETRREHMEIILGILSKISPKIMGNLDEWTHIDSHDVPQQIGGYDCGIFSLTYARYLIEKRPFNFEQKHVGFLRRKICYDLIQPILCLPERPKPNQSQMLEFESKQKNMGLMPSTSKKVKTSCPTKRGMTLRGKKVNQKFAKYSPSPP